MADDPCANEKENMKLAYTVATASIVAGVAGAPETLGASVVVGFCVGLIAGSTWAVAHNQLTRCLRAHGMTAQADTLDNAEAQVESEAAILHGRLQAMGVA